MSGAIVAILAAAGTAIAVGPAAAQAVNCQRTWVGPAGGDWFTAANWQPNTVPDSRVVAVCVKTTNGPLVAAGKTARVGTLRMTNGAITVDGTLQLASFVLTNSDLTGNGTIVPAFTSTARSTISGVSLGGDLTIAYPDSSFQSVLVSGSRTMCGAQLSLCLAGTSGITGDSAATLVLDAATIGGTTSAAPALDAVSLDAIGTGSSRVSVEFSGSVAMLNAPSGVLRIDRWDQLNRLGALTGGGVGGYPDGAGTLIVRRTIVVIDDGGVLTAGPVQTPDGTDALSRLTRVGDSGTVLAPFPRLITPVRHDLVFDPLSHVTVLPAAGPSTIDGRLFANGQLLLRSALQADSVAAYSTALTRIEHGGSLAVGTTVQFGDTARLELSRDAIVRAPGGVTMVDHSVLADARNLLPPACGATVDGPLTLGPQATVDTRLIAPDPDCADHFSVTGSAHLDGTLLITSNHGPRAQLGDRIVLIDAAAIQGTFRAISGQNFGANHWQIDYTATQVTATLVAGNV